MNNTQTLLDRLEPRLARATVGPQDKQVITHYEPPTPLTVASMTRRFTEISGAPNQSGPQVSPLPPSRLPWLVHSPNSLNVHLFSFLFLSINLFHAKPFSIVWQYSHKQYVTWFFIFSFSRFGYNFSQSLQLLKLSSIRYRRERFLQPENVFRLF